MNLMYGIYSWMDSITGYRIANPIIFSDSSISAVNNIKTHTYPSEIWLNIQNKMYELQNYNYKIQ